MLVGSRKLENGEKAAREIMPRRALSSSTSQASSIDAAAARISKEFGHLDILVNNAGISKIEARRAPSRRL